MLSSSRSAKGFYTLFKEINCSIFLKLGCTEFDSFPGAVQLALILTYLLFGILKPSFFCSLTSSLSWCELLVAAACTPTLPLI
jgi:hypothetical protein